MTKNFDTITQEEWRAALRGTVLIEGAPDEMLYNRAVSLFTAPGGIAADCLRNMQLPPKLHVYPDVLPLGQPEHDLDGKSLHVVFGNISDEELQKYLKNSYENLPAYFSDTQTTKADGTRHAVRQSSLFPQDRHIPRVIFNRSNRSRGPYDPTELPDHSAIFANTRGPLNDWRQELKQHLISKNQKPSEPTLWEFYQERMFSDEIMKRFGAKGARLKRGGQIIEAFPLWKDWIRGLRVMAGLSTADLSDALGYKRPPSGAKVNNYSNLETGDHGVLSSQNAKKLLVGNYFKFPEIEMDGKRIVHPFYAKRFCDMVGCGEVLYATPIKKRYLEGIKLMADAYLQGLVPMNEMPAVNEVLPLVTGYDVKPSHHYDQLETKNDKMTIDGKNYSYWLGLLPYIDHEERKRPSYRLSRDDAFILACNAALTTGEFFRIYRESTNLSVGDVCKKMGYLVGQSSRVEKHAFTKWRLFEDILSASNPYQLPADEKGLIRADVKKFIVELNERCEFFYNRNQTRSASEKMPLWTPVRRISERLYNLVERKSEAPAPAGDSEIKAIKVAYDTECRHIIADNRAWIKRISETRLRTLKPGEESTLEIRDIKIPCKREKRGLCIKSSDAIKIKAILLNRPVHGQSSLQR